MPKSTIGLRRLSKFLDRTHPIYPLQRSGLLWATIAGLLVCVILFAPLAGFAVFVLIACCGLLWRRDEPPILVYCIAYQWLFVAVGYFYNLFTGTFPFEDYTVGDLIGATFLSLLGFLIIVLGVRVGLRVFERRLALRRKANEHTRVTYDVRLLFWWVILVFSINWFVEIFPRQIAFNQAQIISAILLTREILLCLLLLSVVLQKSGYRYGIAAAVFVSLPQSISQHSAFSWIFIFLALVLLKEWRPWSSAQGERSHNKKIVFAALVIGISLFLMALIWQGGVKANWRAALRTETNLSSPLDKLSVLADIVGDVYSSMDWSEATTSLASRMSGTFYFSHALNHVPAAVPHEEGALTWRAIEHTFKPRFIFTDKPDLGSNSWLIWQYTGLPAAGQESDTSIGLTYMAEFYVDYGIFWMFLPLFCWGLIIGLVYGGLFWISPSQLIGCAAVIVLLPQPFASFEGEIAYLLGGLIQNTVVFVVFLYLFGALAHRKFLHADSAPRRSRQQIALPVTD